MSLSFYLILMCLCRPKKGEITMEITKEELQHIIVEAINQDRTKRDEEAAKNTRYIRPGGRQEARDLYRQLANIWLEQFTQFCEVNK